MQTQEHVHMQEHALAPPLETHVASDPSTVWTVHLGFSAPRKHKVFIFFIRVPVKGPLSL